MLIDISQKQEGPELSYVDENGIIKLTTVPLKNGYYEYVVCDSSDPQCISGLRSFKGNHVKKQPAKYFQYHALNEFIGVDLEKEYPDVHKLVSPLNIPTPYSVDIETEITDEYGYSSEEKAENRVLSISITDTSLNSILFMLENPDHPVILPTDRNEIDSVLREALAHHYNEYEYGYEIRIFKDEREMISTFFDCIRNYFHSIFGWNYIQYDNQYLFNRAKRLNIDPRKMSPVGQLTKKRLEIQNQYIMDYEIPRHRIVNDYMALVKSSQIYRNLESYSLNYIAELLLGLKKVSYTGNLRSLYKDNFPRFVGYSLVDTILVMLIHKVTNLYNGDFFQSYYTKVPYQKISQNAISEALVFNELRPNNIVLCESEFNHYPKRKYQGGYVKPPTKKFTRSVSGFDYNALYPNTIITVGLSPEMKVDAIEVDENGWPKSILDKQKWEAYKSKGKYCLSPMGRIYDVSSDGLYVRIEKKLQQERGVYKKCKEDIYLRIMPALEEEMKRRGLK